MSQIPEEDKAMSPRQHLSESEMIDRLVHLLSNALSDQAFRTARIGYPSSTAIAEVQRLSDALCRSYRDGICRSAPEFYALDFFEQLGQ